MCMRGEIYYTDFGKNNNSHRQSGVRPTVIISNNKNNCNSDVVTVVPFTSKIYKKPYLPTHVFIPKWCRCGLNRPSVALAEQVESIDKERLLTKVGMIRSDIIMDEITKALQVQIGVYDEYN